jgi:hypothetical protein
MEGRQTSTPSVTTTQTPYNITIAEIIIQHAVNTNASVTLSRKGMAQNEIQQGPRV